MKSKKTIAINCNFSEFLLFDDKNPIYAKNFVKVYYSLHQNTSPLSELKTKNNLFILFCYQQNESQIIVKFIIKNLIFVWIKIQWKENI